MNINTARQILFLCNMAKIRMNNKEEEYYFFNSKKFEIEKNHYKYKNRKTVIYVYYSHIYSIEVLE